MAGKLQSGEHTGWLTLTVPVVILVAMGMLVARHTLRRWYARLTVVHARPVPVARQSSRRRGDTHNK
jgi:hypothetical protein